MQQNQICNTSLTAISIYANGVIRQTIYQEAEDIKTSFIKTVDSYNADARRYGSMEMDLYAEHTWDEVLAVQQRISQERDVETSKGFRAFWRTRLRRFADNSAVVAEATPHRIPISFGPLWTSETGPGGAYTGTHRAGQQRKLHRHC